MWAHEHATDAAGMDVMYQGIFATDFDAYLDGAIALFLKAGGRTADTRVEGIPDEAHADVPLTPTVVPEHPRAPLRPEARGRRGTR